MTITAILEDAMKQAYLESGVDFPYPGMTMLESNLKMVVALREKKLKEQEALDAKLAARKPKLSLVFNDNSKRWEAETPPSTDRRQLADLGWKWDRLNQVWYAPNE